MKKKDRLIRNKAIVDHYRAGVAPKNLAKKYGFLDASYVYRILKKNGIQIRGPQQNLIGQKFGRLTVIKQLASPDNNRRWLCKCECGNEHRAKTKDLNTQRTRSCGCLRRDLHTIHGHAAGGELTPEYVMWKSAKGRAKKKNLPFSISPDDIRIPSYCAALGIPLRHGKGKPIPNSPSLDRFVPEQGYVPENIQIISYRANTIKQNASLEEVTKVAGWTENETARVLSASTAKRKQPAAKNPKKAVRKKVHYPDVPTPDLSKLSDRNRAVVEGHLAGVTAKDLAERYSVTRPRIYQILRKAGVPVNGPLQDLTGQTFGRLTVLRQTKKVTAERRWLCRCGCGKEHAANGSELKRGGVRSCGCQRGRATIHGHTAGGKISTEYTMFCAAKGRAERLGIPFTITLNDINIPSVCPVLEIVIQPNKGKLSANSPSLDRIIPHLGYTPANIAVISHRGNAIKQNASAEELAKMVEWMAARVQQKKFQEQSTW